MTHKQRFNKITQKTWEVAKKVFYVIACVGLYLTNPSIFAIGFIIGVIKPKQTSECMQKIQALWEKKKIWMGGIFVAAAFLSLPVTAGASAFFLSAHFGSYLSKKATA